jgi:hypothetical protein
MLIPGGDDEKHRVGVVNSESGWLGALPDQIHVKKSGRVLLQNSAVMLLQPRPHAAQQCDCTRLRPTVPHEPQACQKREDFILRKIILSSAAKRIHAVEGEVRFLWIAGTLVAAKAPIGFEESP